MAWVILSGHYGHLEKGGGGRAYSCSGVPLVSAHPSHYTSKHLTWSTWSISLNFMQAPIPCRKPPCSASCLESPPMSAFHPGSLRARARCDGTGGPLCHSWGLLRRQNGTCQHYRLASCLLWLAFRPHKQWEHQYTSGSRSSQRRNHQSDDRTLHGRCLNYKVSTLPKTSDDPSVLTPCVSLA